MNCSRFETLLTDYLEGTLEAPVFQAVDAHFQGCQECQTLSAEVQALRDQLGAFPVAATPSGLLDRILERTTGKPTKRSFWSDLVMPTLQPFLTQRYAFATVVLFVFLSLMVNLAGPPAAAFLSPSRLAEGADRFSSRVSQKWAEMQDFKTRVTEEISLLSEDLYARIDYHLISMLFKSYAESVEEQNQKQESESGEGTAQQQ